MRKCILPSRVEAMGSRFENKQCQLAVSSIEKKLKNKKEGTGVKLTA